MSRHVRVSHLHDELLLFSCHGRMRRGNVFARVFLSVCRSVRVLTVKDLDLKISISLRRHAFEISRPFSVKQGHWVKVKVTHSNKACMCVLSTVGLPSAERQSGCKELVKCTAK